MILVSLIYNREILNFAIQDKIIKYTDRKWGKWIQCIPEDKGFKRKVIMSRGRFPHFLIEMFTLSEKERAEYDAAKTEDDLAEIIIKDAKDKGCKLLSKEVKETPPEKKLAEVPKEEPKEENNIIKDKSKEIPEKESLHTPIKQEDLYKAIRPVRGYKNDA